MSVEEHANDVVQMLRLMAGSRKPNLLDDAADLIESLIHERLERRDESDAHEVSKA